MVTGEIRLPSPLSDPNQQQYGEQYQASLHAHSYQGVGLQGISSANRYKLALYKFGNKPSELLPEGFVIQPCDHLPLGGGVLRGAAQEEGASQGHQLESQEDGAEQEACLKVQSQGYATMQL